MSRVKLNDVDALFFGTDAVDRMFLGETLIWNGDTVPELEGEFDVYYDWSSLVGSTLESLGTDISGDFDLPQTGSGAAQAVIMPAFQPGDFAWTYKGEIDPAIGTEPRSYERLASTYPYLYLAPATGTTITNTGTEGGSLTAETTAIPNNDRHMSFPGASTNYLSIPDAANLDITVSIEITVRLGQFNWDNRVGNQRIVAKSGSARAYEVFMGSGTTHGNLCFTRDNVTIAVSSERVPFLNDHNYWIRVTYNSGTGETKFYYAADATAEPGSFTQLGTTQTNVTGAIVANAETLKIGTATGTADMFKGRIYKVLVRDADVSGTTVVNIDIPADTGSMTQDVTTTFTATSGQTVTLTKSGTPPATVRVIPVSTATYSDGRRWATGTNLAELEIVPNQLQIVWMTATLAARTTTFQEIYPVLQVNSPYQANAWGMYLDVLQAEMKFTMQISTTSTDEVFATGSGPVVPTTGTGVFAVALIEVDGVTYAWNVKYSSGGFVFESLGGTSTPERFSVTGIDLIGATNTFYIWQGLTGFTPTRVGVINIPDFAVDDDNIQWDTTGTVRIKQTVEDHLKVVALDTAPTYAVGEFWRANDDGQMAIATDAVDEGDVFAVITASPVTFQQLKVNHPAQRKALYRPRYTNYGYQPGAGISVGATDDFFVWVVVSGNGEDDYITNSSDSTGSAIMRIKFGRDANLINIDMEIVDDSGNTGYVLYDNIAHKLWNRGFSEPTLLAMAIDRGTDSWRGWFYDDAYGMTNFANTADETGFTFDTITLDQVDFFGPELAEGYSNTLVYGGGWAQGVGIAPDDERIIRLWEQAVYGYSHI